MTTGNIGPFTPQRNGGTILAAAAEGREGTMLDRMDAVELSLPETASHLAGLAREKLGEARQPLESCFKQLQREGGASL